ncbi:MAG: flagellar hook-length control protein FliK [Spirochaetota bacterium]
MALSMPHILRNDSQVTGQERGSELRKTHTKGIIKPFSRVLGEKNGAADKTHDIRKLEEGEASFKPISRKSRKPGVQKAGLKKLTAVKAPVSHFKKTIAGEGNIPGTAKNGQPVEIAAEKILSDSKILKPSAGGKRINQPESNTGNRGEEITAVQEKAKRRKESSKAELKINLLDNGMNGGEGKGVMPEVKEAVKDKKPLKPDEGGFKNGIPGKENDIGRKEDTGLPRIIVIDARREHPVSSREKLKPENIPQNQKEKIPASLSNEETQIFKIDTGQPIPGTGSRGGRVIPFSHEQRALLQQLRENGNNQIVKQTGIILRDNDRGEIRLVLRPEKLGKVSIRLNLNDNNIAGRIIVENNNVKEVFEHNLDSLYRALRENGFETSGLKVSIGNEQSGAGKREEDVQRPYVEKVKCLEEHIPLVDDFRSGYNLINLVV